jgi:hypothetical protein
MATTYNYSGKEVMTINKSFFDTMYDSYESLKKQHQIPANKEVSWSFFHKDDLKRALDNTESIGCGFVYTANDTTIQYHSDKITQNGVPKNADVETIIVLTGVKKNATPLFLKKRDGSVGGVVIASLEPCPKVCMPPRIVNEATPCFEAIYKPLLNNETKSYSTDLGWELNEAIFWERQSVYQTGKAGTTYQRFDSAYFSKEAIQRFIDDKDCIGIRCGVILYYNTFRCMFVIGVNNKDDRTWQYDKDILFSDLDLELPKTTTATAATIVSKSVPMTKKPRKKT